MSEPSKVGSDKLNTSEYCKSDNQTQEPYTPIFDRDTHVALVVEARNIYNQAYNFTEGMQKQLAAQISAVAVNLDTGEAFNLTHRPKESKILSYHGFDDGNSASTRDNSTTNNTSLPSLLVPVKLLYLSEQTLGRSGRYVLKVLFTDLTQGRLQVDGCHGNHSRVGTTKKETIDQAMACYLAGSTFRIPAAANVTTGSVDLYLAKGPQKGETSTYLRLAAYPSPRTGATMAGWPLLTAPSIPSQHYDARFDSVFMLKGYLKDDAGNQFPERGRDRNFTISLHRVRDGQGGGARGGDQARRFEADLTSDLVYQIGGTR